MKSSHDAPSLLGHVAGSGAMLARVEPGLALFAFPHEPSVEAGLRTAHRAAELLKGILPSDAALALHCAPVRIRERAGRLTLGGIAVERPERWWPAPASAHTAESLALTDSALAHLGRPPRAPCPPPRQRFPTSSSAGMASRLGCAKR
ncbi:hypothetical protein ACLEPN_14065 [Myxococcus sp. 1LA]